jgi:hypothetical protein
MPFYTYEHLDNNRSVTGGYVYRGSDYAAIQGIYFFADYYTGRTWGSQYDGNDWTTEIVITSDGTLSISSFGEDESGELYILDHEGNGNGRLLQMVSP